MLPSGTKGDVFIADCLYVLKPASLNWSKIYKGNLVWGYSKADGWNIYQYNIGDLYYSQDVYCSVTDHSASNTGPVGNGLKFSGTYIGQLGFRITPATIPDTETSYTLTWVMYNPMHFSATNGTIHES